jgi:hypothetical protein
MALQPEYAGQFPYPLSAIDPSHRFSRDPAHAVAEVDDSRAEGAGLDECEIQPALALGREHLADVYLRAAGDVGFGLAEHLAGEWRDVAAAEYQVTQHGELRMVLTGDSSLPEPAPPRHS